MTKNIFIFEFVSGGGFSQVSIPPSLFSEGFSMLRSIIEDFKQLGFKIITLLDFRINYLSNLLNVDLVKFVGYKKDYNVLFKQFVEESEYCFIIAPEFSNILKNLTKIVKKKKKKLLSIDLEGIKLGTSKINTYKFFKKCKLSTPETYLIPNKNGYPLKELIIEKYMNLKSPIIVKPNDGVGAESIFYFKNKKIINSFFKYDLSKLQFNREFILQEYINGKDMSISLLNYFSEEDKIAKSKILSINSQNIKKEDIFNKFEYIGGFTPIKNNEIIMSEILEALKKVDFSNFFGFFGIDFILTNKGFFFIEINPRLTTSYIGIRNTIDKNIAELIIKSKSKSNNLKDLKIKIQKNSIFTKLDLSYKGSLTDQQLKEDLILEIIQKYPEFITPPISLNKDLFSCFIATKEENMKSSIDKINQIKSFLLELQFKIR